ncbi:hypothetical protein H4I96_09454 [Botrytis cinerea]
MLIRQITALAIALLAQAPVALSDDVVGHRFMQNGIQVLNQEQAQVQQCQNQNQKMQGQQSQCQSSTRIYQSQSKGSQGRREQPQAQQSQSLQNQGQIQQGQQPQAQQSQASQNQGLQPQLTNTGGLGSVFHQMDLVTPTECLALAMIAQVDVVDPMSIALLINCAFQRTIRIDSPVDRVQIPRSDRLLARIFAKVVSFQHLAYEDIGDTGVVLPCGDPSLGQFCCDEGRGFECCSTPSKVFTLGKGTTFTENSLNSATTANSNTDSQPQRSSQSTTTRTQTETATQVQTQISSATQTVVRTSISVSVSVQIVTSNQLPTSTIVFSSAAPAISSTSQPGAEVYIKIKNSQPLSSSSLWDANPQPSASSSSNEDQGQNGGTSSTSVENSQASNKAQNQTDSQNIQSTVSNFLKSPNMTAIIAGSSAVAAIVMLGIVIVCFRKRRRAKKSGIQLRDGKRRGSESERGASEKMGKMGEDGNRNASIGVFVTVSEKLKGLKDKAHTAHLKEDDRVSREFDGALGGGMYLEGGTMGRGRPRGDLGRSSGDREFVNTRDMSTNPDIPHPFLRASATPELLLVYLHHHSFQPNLEIWNTEPLEDLSLQQLRDLIIVERQMENYCKYRCK